MNKVRAHIWISGRVQGVFYRANTQEVATNLGLTGWVKNCFDGRVEAVCEGEKTAVEKMVEWCHEGPTAAVVTEVDVSWSEATGEHSRFSIQY